MFNKKLESYVNKKRILLCLSDAIQPTISSELKKIQEYRNYRLFMEMRN